MASTRESAPRTLLGVRDGERRVCSVAFAVTVTLSVGLLMRKTEWSLISRLDPSNSMSAVPNVFPERVTTWKSVRIASRTVSSHEALCHLHEGDRMGSLRPGSEQCGVHRWPLARWAVQAEVKRAGRVESLTPPVSQHLLVDLGVSSWGFMRIPCCKVSLAVRPLGPPQSVNLGPGRKSAQHGRMSFS